MAKVLMPLLSGSASGQFAKAMVFQKNGRVREYVEPANPQTENQMAVRNKLGDVQRQLKQLGAVLREELRMGFGPTWNAQIVKELTANDGALLASLDTAWDAFDSGDRGEWATEDTAVKNILVDGAAFYSVAKATYDMAQRLDVTITLPAPVTDNAAAVKAAWIANS